MRASDTVRRRVVDIGMIVTLAASLWAAWAYPSLVDRSPSQGSWTAPQYDYVVEPAEVVDVSR